MLTFHLQDATHKYVNQVTLTTYQVKKLLNKCMVHVHVGHQNVKALIKLVLLKESTVYSVYCINILHFGTVVSCDCILAGTFIRNF